MSDLAGVSDALGIARRPPPPAAPPAWPDPRAEVARVVSEANSARASGYLPQQQPAGGAAPAPPPPQDTVVRPGQEPLGDYHAQRASDYVRRTMEIEGSGKDPRSSAVGGFIDSTWLSLMRNHFPDRVAGLDKQQVLDLRSNDDLRAQATAAYASDNAGMLRNAGQPVTPATMRLAHFLGPGGAVKVLSAPPGTPVSQILSPEAIAANPATFAGNTVDGVIRMAEAQMAGGEDAPLVRLRNAAFGGFTGESDALMQRLLSKADRDSAAFDDALAASKDLRGAARAMMGRWASESDKPPQNMHETWQQWSGIASAFALLGGLVGHSSTAALSAAGTMLQSANAADERSYDRAYKQWSDHTDRSMKLIELLNGEARNIVDDARKSYEQTVSELGILSSAYNLREKLNPESVYNQTRDIEKQRVNIELTKLRNEESTIRSAIEEKTKEYKDANGGQEPPASLRLEWDRQARSKVTNAGQMTQFRMAEAAKLIAQGVPEEEAYRRTGMLPQSGTRGVESRYIQERLSEAEAEAKAAGRSLSESERVKVLQEAHSTWAKTGAMGRQEAGVDLSKQIFNDQEIGMIADSYVAGNDRALVGLARGNSGVYAMARVWKSVGEKLSEQEQREFREVYGRSPTDEEKKTLDADRGRRLALAQAEFQGIRAGERTAFTRAASLVTASAEAKQFSPIALEMSNKVDRTRYPNFNAIQLAVEKGTGDEAVVQFHIANVSLADAYAQVIGRGNAQITDAARAQALSLLETRWSKGQYKAGVEMINREIDTALKAPEEVIRRFREGFLQRQTAAPAAPVGATQPSPPGGNKPPLENFFR